MNPGVDREQGLLEKAPALFGAYLENSVCNPQDFNADPTRSVDTKRAVFVSLLLFVCLFTSCFEVVKFLVRYFPKRLV